MDRKKLIVRMAAAAIVIFILASAGRIVGFLHEISIKNELVSSRKYLITRLGKEYQDYLNETAAKIKHLPVNQHLINQITSDVLKKRPVTKLYLWMSNPQDQFIFGVPHPVFDRMNKSYDRYLGVIEADGYYVDRNDFLFKLVHRHEQINFTQFESRVLKHKGDILRSLSSRQVPGGLEWRFYREPMSVVDYTDAVRLELSAPVMDDDQQMIGTLYLKVNDLTTPIQRRDLTDENFFNTIFFPACEVLFGLSLVFLWFLLPSWVYIDARQRDVKNALRWALLTVVSLGFAWLIYLIVRPAALKSFFCPQCEKELNGTRAFCPYCGFDLSHVFCPQCQYPVKSEWTFCPSCRTDLSKKPQTQGEIPEEESK